MQYPTNFSLIDTHCHLDFEVFENDRELILKNALNAGVEAVVNPGINIETSQEAINLANKFTNLYAAVGIHPNEAYLWNDETITIIKDLANSDKVIAIGEIGLDYYRDRTSPKIQRDVFEKQLELASQFDLPVIIHNRNANEDLIAILSSWYAGLQSSSSTLLNHPGVLHSFSADAATAHACTQMNFFIGITGPITYPNSKDLQSLIATMSLDHLLIETDAPYLAPQPKRGKRNEPAYLQYTAQKIADLQGLELEMVAQKTSANAKLLFQIGDKTLA